MQKGFTLIELMVVAAIMAVIIGIAATSYQQSLKLARDGRRKTDLEQLRQALETYRSENGVYPVTQDLAPLVPNYINAIPTDPKTTSYKFNVLTTNYRLCAYLEVAPATSSCAGYTCGTQPCNYGVTQP